MSNNRRRKRKESSASKTVKKNPLFSNVIFRILLGLILLALIVSTCILIRLENDDFSKSNNGVTTAFSFKSLRRPSSSQQQPPPPPPHLYPRLPHLPIFPTIENSEELIQQTLNKKEPSIAGIGAILYKFLNELHKSNAEVASLTGKIQNNQQKVEVADSIRAKFFGLVSKHLIPLDAAYRGQSTFPIRQDDSIFVSVAAFREHLLAETLMSLFGSSDHPEKVFVGAIVNNCFNTDGTCKGSPKVVGKDKNGRDVLEHTDGVPDINHIETFCSNTTFTKYCNSGQLRVLYVNETDALGPAAARYYSSKLWGGETFYVQVDSHLHFANGWDTLYVEDLKLSSNYPKSVLSTYPPGFVNFRQEPPYTRGTRLCRCQIRSAEDFLPRIEMEGRCNETEVRPTQMPFMGAGFFFARSEFLIDVPFDPFLPWLFMGEEVALSIRAWTHGWNIYAPRKNLIGHQYRPVRCGEPCHLSIIVICTPNRN